MIAVMHISQAVYLMQILTSAFLAILFLQSGIDKIVDRRGNFEWLKGHFAKSPLAGIVPALLICITIRGGSRGCAQRGRLCARSSIERFCGRVLWRNRIGRSHHGTIFWTANRERICGRGSAGPLFSAHAGRNLFACSVRQHDKSANLSLLRVQ